MQWRQTKKDNICINKTVISKIAGDTWEATMKKRVNEIIALLIIVF